MIQTLPLSLHTLIDTAVLDASRQLESANREFIDSTENMKSDWKAANDIATSIISKDLDQLILRKTFITRDEINPETGVMPETEVIVSRGYTYVDVETGKLI